MTGAWGLSDIVFGAKEMKGAMLHSIAICTTGQRASLHATLHALIKSIDPHRVGMTEVLVVNNGPVEHTGPIETLMTAAFCNSRVSWRVLQESVVGLSRARNLALARAEGAVLTFIDDDICPCGPTWQEAILDSFIQHSEVGLLTGPITCVVPPAVDSNIWWRSTWTDELLACRWQGQSGPCDSGLVYGANASYRRSAMRGLSFPEALGWGAGGRFRLGGEETWFNRQIAKRGWRAWYDIRVAVEHHVEPERFTPDWLLRRSVATGRQMAVFRVMEGEKPSTVRKRARRSCLRHIAAAVVEEIHLHHREAFTRCIGAAEDFGVFSFPLAELYRVVNQLGY